MATLEWNTFDHLAGNRIPSCRRTILIYCQSDATGYPTRTHYDSPPVKVEYANTAELGSCEVAVVANVEAHPYSNDYAQNHPNWPIPGSEDTSAWNNQSYDGIDPAILVQSTISHNFVEDATSNFTFPLQSCPAGAMALQIHLQSQQHPVLPEENPPFQAGIINAPSDSATKHLALGRDSTEHLQQSLVSHTVKRSKGNTAGDNTAREHPLYHNVTPTADGLYHCPFEDDPKANCTHKPGKLKYNYEYDPVFSSSIYSTLTTLCVLANLWTLT